jgi:hypothetical protein
MFAIKETGLEIHADKTQYMFMYRDQDAGRNDDINTGSSSFGSV